LALDDLKRIGHVHRARDAREEALDLGIAIEPVLLVVLLLCGGPGLIRDLPPFDDAD